MVFGIFGLLFALAMWGIARLFPNKKPDDYTPPDQSARDKFDNWGRISGWIMLTAIILVFYVLAVVFPGYQQKAIAADKKIVYAVFPGGFYWFFIGFIFVIGFSAVIYTLLIKLYMRSDFHAFIYYSNQKSGYNAYKAVIPICGTFLVAGIVLLFFLWDYGIYIYKDKIVVHGYMASKAKTYSYHQVKTIDFMPETHDYGAHYQINFSDGENWNTLTDLRDDSDSRDVSYICKQSGLKIDTLSKDPE